MDTKQTKLAEELLFSSKKERSFAKQLYFGTLDSAHLLPYPTVSQEELAAADAIQSQLDHLMTHEVDPQWIDRNATIPDKVIHSLAQIGILGMTVPKQYQGLGMTQYSFCKALELIASRCASTALFANVHQSIGLRALLIFGSEEQKKTWLPPMAKGEKFGAFSLTEPNAGSDASAVETRAVFDSERQIYKITGRKQWTTNGSIADVLTVMARTEVETPQGKQDKITAFLVTPDMAGFQITDAALDKVGMRGTKTSNLAFNAMEVPAANILGPLGGGLKVCLTVLDYGRTAFGATCTGAAKFLVEKAISHAFNRHQFNRSLSSFGLVKQKIASMSAYAYAMEATTYLTAGLIDSGVDDIMLEAAMLKVFASDALWNILYDTMQIFGGRSFFTDEPYERMMRDARLNMIGEGSNEVMRAFIGAVGMRDVGVELKETIGSLKVSFHAIPQLLKWFEKGFQRWKGAKLPIKSEELQSEAGALSKAVRRFGIAVIRALAKHRELIIEEQLLLNRVATSAMAIYTAAAVLSKLERDLHTDGMRQMVLQRDLQIGKFYCREALATINRSLSHLFDPNDAIIYSLSDQIVSSSF